MVIQACLRCGADRMRLLTLRDGLALDGGENTGKRVCDVCGWQGIPIEFDERADWQAFLAGLRDGAEDAD